MSGRVFDALGDATRREILETLGPTEQSAGMIVAALQARRPISQPAVSQHLKALHDAGLVTVRHDATKRIYAIDHAALDAAHDWLTLLVEPLAAFTQPSTRSKPKSPAANEVTNNKVPPLTRPTNPRAAADCTPDPLVSSGIIVPASLREGPTRDTVETRIVSL